MTDPSAHPRRAVVYAVLAAVTMIAQQLAGRAIRDGFFLSHYEAASLPTAMLISSTLSIGVVLLTSRVYRRVAPARLVPWVFLASALWFVAEGTLSQIHPRVAAASLYLHTSSFGAVVVSGFWSVVNERFDPHTAKRVIGRIAGGATLGGVLGGLAAWQGAGRLSIPAMIAVLAGVNVVCAVAMQRLGAGVPQRQADLLSDPAKKSPSVASIMEETPYLFQLAFLVAASALAAAAFDYVFKARAAAAFPSGDALVSFFSLFYLGLGVGTFVFQQLFAAPALRYLGLTATVATMPSAVVALGGLSLFVGGLWSVLALRVSSAVLESSLYRSGYELLYTPLTPEKKRPTKTMIDVGADKLGAALGGGIALVMVQALPEQAETFLLGLAVVCGMLALRVTKRLHAGYVASLADSLRSGRISSDLLDTNDRVTRRTVDQTRLITAAELAATPDEREIEEPVDVPAGSRGGRHPVQTTLGVRLESKDDDEILRGIAALRSGRAQRVQATLRWFRPLPPELVPSALPLLHRRRLQDQVFAALRPVAPLHVGLFADTLLGATRPLELRRSMPRLLEQVPTQRCAEVLVAGLTADRLELRFRSAMALRRISLSNPSLRISREAVMEAVADTLNRAARGRFIGGPVDDGLLLGLAFIALSTVLPAGPLRLALEALADEDPARRGTGLEYLENVLPPSLRTALEDRLHSQDAARSAARPEPALLAEFATVETSGILDFDVLIDRLRARWPSARRGD